MPHPGRSPPFRLSSRSRPAAHGACNLGHGPRVRKRLAGNASPATAGLSRPAQWARDPLKEPNMVLRKRRLGTRDLVITTVGFGAWAIGWRGRAVRWGPPEDARAVR